MQGWVVGTCDRCCNTCANGILRDVTLFLVYRFCGRFFVKELQTHRQLET